MPDVESLRSLNGERLAALNHGTIKTPIPGKEGGEVLRRCRTWAASVGEIRIGEEVNSTISIQLSGVETESILKQVESEDNQGNRIRRVRKMLFEQLGIRGEGEFEQFYEFLWRNTKRTVRILFRNIRDLPDNSLENSDESWRLIIDFPFDEAGHGPKDDLSRLQTFMQSHREGARTLCWVPDFLSADAQNDLGKLVVLEHVLSGERFGQYSNHLSPQDRQAAKSQLENQRSVLRQRVLSHLDAAYGLEPLTPGSLDSTHELEPAEHYVALTRGISLRPPVAANLHYAMDHLLSQVLEQEFPAAPHFEAEIKLTHLKKVHEPIIEATQTGDGRVAVDKTLRPLLRQIANPLLLGDMGADATHFVLGHHWRTHFTRKAAETGSAMTVGQLRRWIDDPKPMGLPPEAANLVILAFAAQTNRTFYLDRAPYDASLANLPDRCELREEKLPDEDVWAKAVQRAGSIFGVAISPLRNASNVAALTSAVKQKAGDARRVCRNYCERLRSRMQYPGVEPESADRMRTAVAALALVEQINGAGDGNLVSLLADAEIATSEAAMGECLAKAAELEGNLDAAGWDIFDAISKLTDDRKRDAQTILAEVTNALSSDEHVLPLASSLKGAQARAVRLLTVTIEPPRAEPPRPPVKPPARKTGRTVVDQGSQENLDVPAARDLLQRLQDKHEGSRTVRVNLSWVVESEGNAS